ncbi:3942_t:CDS:2 [Paraglomus occultum]|uniref:Autophagy-related protein 29 n=1 Tax=Paraglomus occultum TaxID=144539 RepID=A0A9N9C4F7_9GLOM|nr:3942_t:CDS:2 [Paraglomus occultum]
MSFEEPLHVVMRLPYKRPPGFIDPPSVIWTEDMEQKLWEILTQNKRASIDWNQASRVLNVPVPYLLRHAAFLYEMQLRGVRAHLRRDEVLSASNSSNLPAGTTRTRASSQASSTKVQMFDVDASSTGHQRSPSSMSSASREHYVTSRTGPTDMVRTTSNKSLTETRRSHSGSVSSSISVPIGQAIMENTSAYQATKYSQLSTHQLPITTHSPYSRRLPSDCSPILASVTTASEQPTIRPTSQQKPEYFVSSTSTAQLSSTHHPPLSSELVPTSTDSILPESMTTASPVLYDHDELSTSMRLREAMEENVESGVFTSVEEENKEVYQAKASVSLSEKLKNLQLYDVAAFLPFGQGSEKVADEVKSSLTERIFPTILRTPVIDVNKQESNVETTELSTTCDVNDDSLASGSAVSPTAKADTSTGGSSQSLSGPNSTRSSFTDIEESVTNSELLDAFMSGVNNSRLSIFSRRSSFFPGS